MVNPNITKIRFQRLLDLRKSNPIFEKNLLCNTADK